MARWSDMVRHYNNAMGIKINGDDIPDVSKMSYQIGDLDTSGSRDATGLLHRARVATKINYEFSWNALEWDMLRWILSHINADKFKLTAPDPRTFEGTYTGDYYVGDRTGECMYYLVEKADIAQYSLKLKFIEY